MVRSATAGPAGVSWVTALGCTRRPGRQRCPGHIEVLRSELPASITWQSNACHDEGVISGWADTYANLRPRGQQSEIGADSEVVISDETVAALRDLPLLDSDNERLVYRARSTTAGIVIEADADQLDELLGHLAAEANHEPNRRRQQRLDDAYAELAEALNRVDQ